MFLPLQNGMRLPMQAQAHCKMIFLCLRMLCWNAPPPSISTEQRCGHDSSSSSCRLVCVHVSEFSHHSVSVFDITLAFCRIYYFISWNYASSLWV